MKIKKRCLFVLAMLPFSGCVPSEGPDLAANTDSELSFEEFRSRTFREPWEGGEYIVEGDIGLDEQELYEYWQRRQHGALILDLDDGDPNVWDSDVAQRLTYCVSNNFGPLRQAWVINAMESAAREWEARTHVNFIHFALHDGAGCTPTNNNVVFNVRMVDVGGEYLAKAFRPSYSRARRDLRIDVTAFAYSAGGLTGMLGHELGHALGFLHEHYRPEAEPDGDCLDGIDNSWDPLTPYDSQSIMHYPRCRGQAGFYWWTQRDREGSSAAYGQGNRGKSDILWRQTSNGSVAVWLMNGSTVQTMGGAIGVAPGWSIAGNGDFDGDGRSDILWRHNDGTVAIWFMNGASWITDANLGLQASTWVIQGVGDFNGDDRADILWRSGNDMAVWHMDGGTRLMPDGNPPDAPANRMVTGVGDFNRDGHDDILLSKLATDGGVVWLMRPLDGAQNGLVGAGTPNGWVTGDELARIAVVDVASGSNSVLTTFQGVGDFNGDGHDDILRRYNDGTLNIQFFTGTQGGAAVASEAWPGTPPTAWSVQGLGDFNGDWKADILWRHTDGTVAIWFMDGGTLLAAHTHGLVSNDWVIRKTGYFNFP